MGQVSKRPLTISAQYGLIDQSEFFDRQIASKDMSGYYLLKNGEFAYNKSYSNDYPWGAVKRLDKYECGALSTLYICFNLDNSIVNSDFISHYFETNKWHKGVSDIAGEGARNHGLLNMSVEDYFLTKHYLPSLIEQEKISYFLNLITARIETQSKIIDKLKSQMNYIIDNIIDYSAPQFQFKDLYINAGEGGTPSTSNNLYYENGSIPFIKIEDLSNKYLNENKDFITEQGLKNSSAWIIPENSIIYSNGATIGRISINTYPVCTKQGILGIIPSRIVLTEYLYYFLRSIYFRKQVHRITVKGTMDCAYLKDLNFIKCYIPALERQEKIIKSLRCLDEKILLEETILNKLKEQKKFLLSNMFI